MQSGSFFPGLCLVSLDFASNSKAPNIKIPSSRSKLRDPKLEASDPEVLYCFNFEMQGRLCRSIPVFAVISKRKHCKKIFLIPKMATNDHL